MGHYKTNSFKEELQEIWADPDRRKDFFKGALLGALTIVAGWKVLPFLVKLIGRLLS